MKGIQIYQCVCGAVFQQNHYNYHIKNSKQHQEYEINETTKILTNYLLGETDDPDEMLLINNDNALASSHSTLKRY